MPHQRDGPVSQATTPGPEGTEQTLPLPLPEILRKAFPPAPDSPPKPIIVKSRPRRRASIAERQQAREVARFAHACVDAGHPLLVTLALIAKRFPAVSLDAALAGYVFRALLDPEFPRG
jgi:hypothetical protein